MHFSLLLDLSAHHLQTQSCPIILFTLICRQVLRDEKGNSKEKGLIAFSSAKEASDAVCSILSLS